ncbi:MAG: hypothetical protein HY720_31365 [Planctomycetes bacterium]|nr:hypothetical protein [Planctomycetota bacterium]
MLGRSLFVAFLFVTSAPVLHSCLPSAGSVRAVDPRGEARAGDVLVRRYLADPFIRNGLVPAMHGADFDPAAGGAIGGLASHCFFLAVEVPPAPPGYEVRRVQVVERAPDGSWRARSEACRILGVPSTEQWTRRGEAGAHAIVLETRTAFVRLLLDGEAPWTLALEVTYNRLQEFPPRRTARGRRPTSPSFCASMTVS